MTLINGFVWITRQIRYPLFNINSSSRYPFATTGLEEIFAQSYEGKGVKHFRVNPSNPSHPRSDLTLRFISCMLGQGGRNFAQSYQRKRVRQLPCKSV